jgi:integrase/recombinase XerD
MVERVRAYNPNWQDPGTLIIYCNYKNKPVAGAYKEHTGAVDERVLDPLRKQLGFHFANHTLRRTFGRMLFKAGTDIVTISKILGHEDVKETIGYIGINLDDMEEGMDLLQTYLEDDKRRKNL